MALLTQQQSCLPRPVAGAVLRDSLKEAQPRTKAFLVRANSNGASPNGASANGASREKAGTVQMYVASADDLDGLYNSPSHFRSKSVPAPRVAAPRSLELSPKEESRAIQKNEKGENKILQVELGLAKSELRNMTNELDKTKHALRDRNKEVSLLRAALTNRDSRLKSAKSELMGLQVSLKDKDAEIQAVFQQLMSGAKERGQLRQQLLDLQQEIKDTRSELGTWTSQASIKGREFKKEFSAALSKGSQESAHREADVKNMLTELLQLSQQVANDALADEAAFEDAS